MLKSTYWHLIKENLELNELDMLYEKQGRIMITQVSWYRKEVNGGTS